MVPKADENEDGLFSDLIYPAFLCCTKPSSIPSSVSASLPGINFHDAKQGQRRRRESCAPRRDVICADLINGEIK